MKNLCQANHNEHDTLLVDTAHGKMYVYDYDKYKGFNGYCTGQDDVSRTLQNTGQWERSETKIIEELLKTGNKENIVIDFGAHVGWFTILAAKLGYDVVAFEGEPESANTLYRNAVLNEIKNRVSIRNEWIGGLNSEISDCDVELVKCDIEGNEQHAVRMIKSLLENKRIKNIVMEISPTFNDTYPAIVEFIKSCGYKAYDIENLGQEFNDVWDFPQTNFLFTRQT